MRFAYSVSPVRLGGESGLVLRSVEWHALWTDLIVQWGFGGVNTLVGWVPGLLQRGLADAFRGCKSTNPFFPKERVCQRCPSALSGDRLFSVDALVSSPDSCL